MFPDITIWTRTSISVSALVPAVQSEDVDGRCLSMSVFERLCSFLNTLTTSTSATKIGLNRDLNIDSLIVAPDKDVWVRLWLNCLRSFTGRWRTDFGKYLSPSNSFSIHVDVEIRCRKFDLQIRASSQGIVWQNLIKCSTRESSVFQIIYLCASLYLPCPWA